MNTASLKNIIAKGEGIMVIGAFFREIGRADELGSGLRKTNKYTPIYSDGAKPTFEEGDVFKMQIPLKNKINDAVNDAASDAVNDVVNEKVIDGIYVGAIDGIIDGAIDGTTKETKRKLSKLLKAIFEDEGKRIPEYKTATQLGSERTVERYIEQLKEVGFVEFIGDSLQTGGYYTSKKLKDLLKRFSAKNKAKEEAVEGTTVGTIDGTIDGAIDGATKETKRKLSKLLKAIIENEGKRIPEYKIATQLGSERTVERYIEQLKEVDFVEFKGQSLQTGGYYISKKLKNILKLYSSKKNEKK